MTNSVFGPLANQAPLNEHLGRLAYRDKDPSISGGIAQSGSFTLNPDSAYVQKATPTGYGQACTAASALLFSPGVVACIQNTTDYDFAFKDSTGVIRGFVPPFTSCIVMLADNSTAAGGWIITNSKLLGITSTTFSTTSSGASSTIIKFVSLDSDRSLLLYGSTSCYARVHRKSTNAWSSPVLVRASIVGGAGLPCILSGTNQVLVVTCSATTALEACTLSINASTDVITVNGSPGTATLSANISIFGQIIAVGSSWVVAYGLSGNVSGIRAISVSGTTPTIGSEATLTPATSLAGALYVSGSNVVAFSSSATVFYSKPYAVSGSTLTPGTGATSTITEVLFRSLLVNPAPRWHVMCVNTTLQGIIVSISGTTTTHSTVNLSAGAPSAGVVAYGDFVGLTANKSCTAHANGGVVVSVNHLIDNGSGVASAGTEINIETRTVSSGSLALLSTTGAVTKFSALGGTQSVTMLTVDNSTTSPTLVDICESGGASAAADTSFPTTAIGLRSARSLTSTVGTVIATTYNSTSPAGGYVYGNKLSFAAPVMMPGSNSAQDRAAGLTTADLWAYSAGVSGGLNIIHKIEVAQP